MYTNVVQDGNIRLVDQNTGRIFQDRSWRQGLQQAVQAKEGLTITAETQPIARITRQRYFRLFRHLCGMTGTAQGGRRELRDVYDLSIHVIPTHRPSRRVWLPTRLFADVAPKETAISEEVQMTHRSGRPVLVGASTIETSERIAQRLDQLQLAYQLLNGKQDPGNLQGEAEIIARAGRKGAITIATNMAGRGTDIKLGPAVSELGGLQVISAEPAKSTRVDRQLAGRAARQGDPGSCQRFACLDDSLFTRHAPRFVKRLKRKHAQGEIPSRWCDTLLKVQRRAETFYARQRRQLSDHDDWLENVLTKLRET